MLIGLIVSCKNEPYVTKFVNYYLSQGIDKIYILYDNSNKNIYIYNDIINNNKVNIIFSNKNGFADKSTQFNAANDLYRQIKNNYEWIIVVDMDEFITTKKNINKTIKQELQTTFSNVDCIKIPWVMMSCNSIQNKYFFRKS